MTKRNKHIQKALDSFGIKWNENGENELNTTKDLDFIISERKILLRDAENGIEELKETIEILKNQISILENLKQQTLVEEYKELNPDKNVFYL